MKYTIAIAGTTHRTRQCAQVFLQNELFEITWVLTPVAKPVGRKQVITPNPMEVFAKGHNIPTIFVEKKLDTAVKDQIESYSTRTPDFLLVVDFGYIVPNWLLKIPKIAPLNIHPSELPRWRGSSPGQFAILFNEQQSAVTLMVMDEKLDHGPIIHQDFFAVDPAWNQEHYYAHAFDMMCERLDEKIVQFAKTYTNPKTRDSAFTAQPEQSPTITAKVISKEQAFVPWDHVVLAMQGLAPANTSALSDLLELAYKANGDFSLTLERASKAFNPWPHLWTIVPTSHGEKRMKILEAEIVNGTSQTALTEGNEKLLLKTVHIEGKNPGLWEAVKNSIVGY